MPNQDRSISLAELIRDKIDAGVLPRLLPEKMWTRYGRGDPCDGCAQPIHPAQVEYEFSMHPDSDLVFQLHIGCIGLWLAELRRRGLPPENPPPAPPAEDPARVAWLARRLAHMVRTHAPYVRCFACLARRLGLTETQVRRAAQMLIADSKLKVVHRLCYACSRTCDSLVPGTDEPDEEQRVT
jgi:hypothetical protein